MRKQGIFPFTTKIIAASGCMFDARAELQLQTKEKHSAVRGKSNLYI